jgi:amidophosphoribosyltransferase
VFAPGEHTSKLTYFGLMALQHRGQESAGMAVSDGSRIMVYKELGLVSQVFNEGTLNSLDGHIAIGHVRYSTSGGVSWDNAQPTIATRPGGGVLALAHNGTLTNAEELDPTADRKDRLPDCTWDTGVLTTLLAGYEGTVEDAAAAVLPQVEGAFSLVFMTEDTLYAARDPHALHPLCLGKLPSGGWVVASESCALDIVGAAFIRHINPGELLTIDSNGLHSRSFANPAPKECLFEYVYLSRPDSRLNDRRVHNVRVKVGKTLAREHPVDADLVIPVPDSGTPAAIGYAAQAREDGYDVQYGQGLVKNAYVGRTFIQPSQSLRQLGIRLKLNPLPSVVENKRLIVVDDSIVRGNTQRQLVAMLREAGAREVHVRIAAPRITWPCFYGIDFATREELIASAMDSDQICKAIGADSLGFISLEGLIAATHVKKENLCRACFDGEYPIRVPRTAPAEVQERYQAGLDADLQKLLETA